MSSRYGSGIALTGPVICLLALATPGNSLAASYGQTCLPVGEQCLCGDGACEAERCLETVDNCMSDCWVCGDGILNQPEDLNSPVPCLTDVCGGCGDGLCMGYQCGESPTICPVDCMSSACGNSVCEPGEGPTICPYDCSHSACGNGTCEPGEGPDICPEDCASACGDCECEGGEGWIVCPIDCGYCGDGICSPCANETDGCAMDCAVSP